MTSLAIITYRSLAETPVSPRVNSPVELKSGRGPLARPLKSPASSSLISLDSIPVIDQTLYPRRKLSFKFSNEYEEILKLQFKPKDNYFFRKPAAEGDIGNKVQTTLACTCVSPTYIRPKLDFQSDTLRLLISQKGTQFCL